MQAALATIFSGSVGCLTGLLQAYSMKRAGNHAEVASTWARAVRVSVVAASASCTVVPLWSHLVTAPVTVVAAGYSHTFLNRNSVYDSAGVVAVHLVGGVCSMLSVGVFARAVRYTVSWVVRCTVFLFPSLGFSAQVVLPLL